MTNEAFCCKNCHHSSNFQFLFADGLETFCWVKLSLLSNCCRLADAAVENQPKNDWWCIASFRNTIMHILLLKEIKRQNQIYKVIRCVLGRQWHVQLIISQQEPCSEFKIMNQSKIAFWQFWSDNAFAVNSHICDKVFIPKNLPDFCLALVF